MSKVDLDDSWALVTGGGTRVGAVVVDELAKAGCNVVVHCSTNEQGAMEVARAVRKTGKQSVVVQADLIDREAIQTLVSTAEDAASGDLGVLVHCAANFERVEHDNLTADSWDKAIALNTTAPYLLTVGLRAALKRSRGSVVAVACTSAIKPWRDYVPYATSKAALVHLVKGLGMALAPDVRVNAVAPGAVMLPESCCESERQRMISRIPLQRIGEPGDVARAVRFLAENDFITGQMLVVDGGYVLT
jgi:pteridine reductase